MIPADPGVDGAPMIDTSWVGGGDTTTWMVVMGMVATAATALEAGDWVVLVVDKAGEVPRAMDDGGD